MRTRIKRAHRAYKRKKAVAILKANPPMFASNYKRVYHVHIRKSAGTSVNAAFWNLGNLKFKQVKREPILVKNNYVFVRNNKDLIEGGVYHFGNSHMPFWSLDLAENTFTFSFFRDPYKRLVSLYKYYIWVAQANPKTAHKYEPYYNTLIKQIGWLGSSFSDFLDRLPKRHIENQLYMFSETYDVEKAILQVEKLTKVYFQDTFEEGMNDLANTLKLPLKTRRERNFGQIEYTIHPSEKEKAMKLLENEYQFYNAVVKKFK